MVASKNTASAVAAKKVMGLKDLKKAQKEKSAAKRVAAAEKVKVSKLEAAAEKAMATEIKNARIAAEAEERAAAAQVESADSLDNTGEADTSIENADVTEFNDTETAIEDDAVVATEVTVAPVAEVSANVDSSQRSDSKLNPAANAFIIGSSLNTKLNPAAKEFVVAKPNNVDTSSCTILEPVAKDSVINSTIVTSNSPILHGAAITSEPVIDITTHRRALEAALYDNMETPRQMVMRCNYIVSVDAEYHSTDKDDDAVSDVSNEAKCLDSNNFEIIPLATGLTLADITVSIPSTPSLSVDDLFAKVSATGASKISAAESTDKFVLDSIHPWAAILQVLSSPSMAQADSNQSSVSVEADIRSRSSSTSVTSRGSRSLEDVEAEMRSRSSFTTATSRGCRSVEDVEAEMRSRSSSTTATCQGSRSLEEVETEMWNALIKSSSATVFVDPAIVSYKIKQQSPATTAIPAHNDISFTKKEESFSAGGLTASSFSSRASSHSTRSSSLVHFDPKAQGFTPITSRSVSPPSSTKVDATGVVGSAAIIGGTTLEQMLQEHLKTPRSTFSKGWEIISRAIGFRSWFRSAQH